MNDQGECKEDGDAGGTGEHGIFLAKHNAYLARRTRGRTAWFRFSRTWPAWLCEFVQQQDRDQSYFRFVVIFIYLASAPHTQQHTILVGYHASAAPCKAMARDG